jgi:hypothetical protein
MEFLKLLLLIFETEGMVIVVFLLFMWLVAPKLRFEKDEES